MMTSGHKCFIKLQTEVDTTSITDWIYCSVKKQTEIRKDVKTNSRGSLQYLDSVNDDFNKKDVTEEFRSFSQVLGNDVAIMMSLVLWNSYVDIQIFSTSTVARSLNKSAITKSCWTGWIEGAAILTKQFNILINNSLNTVCVSTTVLNWSAANINIHFINSNHRVGYGIRSQWMSR